MAAQDDKHPRRDPINAFRPVADEGGLVVMPTSAEVQVMNPVGSKVYELLDGKHSEEDIVRAVMSEFEVDEDEARRDVRTFIEDLRKRGMLATAGSGEAAGE